MINSFGDTNVTRIFYKSSQIYGTETKSDSYLVTEGVLTWIWAKSFTIAIQVLNWPNFWLRHVILFDYLFLFYQGHACLFLYQIAFLREFRTFDDKFSAINFSTGVSESLKNMILRHRRHGQKLAVGKHEYKIIIENTMVSPNSLHA
jgi:hypothetical protein